MNNYELEYTSGERTCSIKEKPYCVYNDWAYDCYKNIICQFAFFINNYNFARLRTLWSVKMIVYQTIEYDYWHYMQ